MNAPFHPLTPQQIIPKTRIGVFDSGLGGLSVLRAMRAQMPLTEMIYVADSGHAPYGEKQVSEIVARSEHISDFLRQQGAQAIVIACNTATAHAVQGLRSKWPDLPIIGVEPGVKPAVARSRSKRVGVLATPSTLSSPKFQSLVQRHGEGAQIVLQACPGLAKEIERGELDTPTLRALVQTFATPLREAGCDTVVLGCTHYPFVQPLFEAELGPDVCIVDTANAIAKRVAELLPTQHISTDTGHTTSPAPTTQFWTSGDPAHLANTVGKWFGHQITANALP